MTLKISCFIVAEYFQYKKEILMKNINKLVIIFTCCLSAFYIHAKPFLSPYPGAKLQNKVVLEGEQTRLVTQFNRNETKAKQFTFDSFIGFASHYSYDIKNVASLKVTKNYQEALNKAGFTINYMCSLDECYSGDRYEDKKRLGEKSSYFNLGSAFRNPYYIFATKGTDKLEAAVALYVGQYKNETGVQLTTIDIKEIETGLITADLSALKTTTHKNSNKAPRKDKKGTQDHPLLSRYPGSYIEDFKQVDYEEFNIPVGVVDKKTKQIPTLDVIGDMTQITYVVNNVSSLKIYHNYVGALVKEGFETVFSCQKSSCSKNSNKRKIREDINQLGDVLAVKLIYNYSGQPRYQVMKKTLNEQTTYAAFFIGNYQGHSRIQLVVMQTTPLQTGLIETNSDKVLEQLAQKGKASIYGVQFDYDKASIKPESKQALDTIAQVLDKNKQLSLYVVGHTDDKGSAEYNLNLSKRRADAVVKALITNYGVSKSRLFAHGAGPYSPVATNNNELGRELNRRVELVEKLSDKKN
jgi:outer membrane protein OmpA-like peptidoglycan-associated protein